MAEANESFSAAEAAVYDRQMRLWGVEAQQRLQRSHVLICGLSPLGAELAKNLVLSGMTVSLQDTAIVTAEEVETHFFLSSADVGKNRAEACLDKVQELNPLVKVACETKELRELPNSFVNDFNVVCLVNAHQSTELRMDALCRGEKIAFFSAHTYGFEGVFFADLGEEHTYVRTSTGDSSSGFTDPIKVSFPSLEQSFKVPWSSLLSKRKRGPAFPRTYVKHRLLQAYEVSGRTKIFEDGDAYAKMAAELLPENGLDPGFIPSDEMEEIARTASTAVVPVCAIMAGMLGQEVVKAISQKDEPICNVFCFDGAGGLVRRIG